MDLKEYIANVSDFPKKGIMFRDITPLMANGEVYKYVNEKFVEFAKKVKADIIVGPEARGFIFGCPVAHELGLGFIPIRKPGKLPRETVSYEYDLEYGTNVLSVHADAFNDKKRVLIVDDLLATGWTVDATIKLVNKLGGEVVGCAFLIELKELEGAKNLKNSGEILTLIQY